MLCAFVCKWRDAFSTAKLPAVVTRLLNGKSQSCIKGTDDEAAHVLHFGIFDLHRVCLRRGAELRTKFIQLAR